jgi:hypothetical protein
VSSVIDTSLTKVISLSAVLSWLELWRSALGRTGDLLGPLLRGELKRAVAEHVVGSG